MGVLISHCEGKWGGFFPLYSTGMADWMLLMLEMLAAPWPIVLDGSHSSPMEIGGDSVSPSPNYFGHLLIFSRRRWVSCSHPSGRRKITYRKSVRPFTTSW